MSRVDANVEILNWALSRAGMSKESLLKNPDKYSFVVKWMEGVSRPTLKQLEEIASITSTPLGFFFLDKPPVEKIDIPFYRTKKEDDGLQISIDLFDTITDIKTRQNWIREYFIEEGFRSLPFINSVSINDTPVLVAAKIKQYLKLNDNWTTAIKTWSETIELLRDKIEQIGVFIVINGVVKNNNYRKLNVNEFRGFVMVDEYAPFIFINGSDVKAAQMFTLIHELTHLFVGQSAINDLKDLQPSDFSIETFCNKVAAEFLVPEKELKHRWIMDNNIFSNLSKIFKVSEIVIARRALDLELINRSDFFAFYCAYTEKEFYKKNSSEGGNFYFNQNSKIGKKFISYVLSAIRENRILYTDAYDLTNLYGNTFEKYISLIEGQT